MQYHPNKITSILICLWLFGVSSKLVASSEPEGKFYGAKHTDYPSWFKESFLDFNEDLDEAKQAGKRILIFFHQEGCPYCNALVDRNLAQKDIQELMRAKLDVININMWGDRELTYFNGKKYTEKTLAEALRVQFTPTLLFYDENGKVILRLNGYRSPDRFKVELNYVTQKQEKKFTPRNYLHANYKPGKSSKTMHSEPFYHKGPVDLSNKNKSKPFVVFFEQKDCPNCDTLHSKILPDKELRNILSHFDVYQLDMWSKTPVITPQGKKVIAKEWAKQLNVQFAPSILVFEKNNEEIIRSEAFFKLFHTQGILDYVKSGSYKKEPSFQRYLSARADKIREQGKDVNIWKFAD